MLTHPVASRDKSCNTRSPWIFTAYSRSCAPRRNALRRRSSPSNGWPLAACRNGAGGPLSGWRRRKQPRHPCWRPRPGRQRRNADSVRRHGNGWRTLRRKDGQLGKPPRKRPEHRSSRQLGISRAVFRLPACPGHSVRPRKHFLSLPSVGDGSAVCEVPSPAGVELCRVSKTGTGRSLAGLQAAGSLLFENCRTVDSFALEEHRRYALGR
jgi:hypothetical protein